MKDVVLYIHGKDGSAAESEHYRALFPDCEVVGLDYHGNTPWEAGKEIIRNNRSLCKEERCEINGVGTGRTLVSY